MYRLKSRRKNDMLLVCRDVLKRFKIRHTYTHLKELLEAHPDYPSLLCIKDILAQYGVQSAAIRKGKYSYDEFETPFICAIQQADWPQASFTVVTSCNDKALSYLDPISGDPKSCTLEAFEKMDKEVVLLLDGENGKDEVNYAANKDKERTAQFVGHLPLWVACITIVLTGIYSVGRYPLSESWVAIFFLLSSSVGLAISVLLLWHEIDAHNPFLKEVCGGQGKKMNCDAVLGSDGSQFLGISWSSWGFAYFASFVFSQVLFAQQSNAVQLWSIFSLLAAPYILYSVYYQWKIVKQWCPLCLSVQTVLFVNAVVSCTVFFREGNNLSLQFYPVALVVLLGIGFLMLAYYGVPLIKQARESKNYERKWKRIRYNPDIFNYLLTKSTPITIPHEELGIVLGNENARNEIVKVCNPYCGPCSKAHPELEQLLESNADLKVRVIFTASGDEEDVRTAPVVHFLAIEEKYGKDAIHRALDDWYLKERKDYEVFADSYPMNGELKQQDDKIKAMSNWCRAMKIRATPTIFVNGYELPEGYRIDELKNFF